MIQFVLTWGHFYTLREVAADPSMPGVRLITYDRLIRSRKLPRATYVFTDIDRLGYADLELAARLYREMKVAGLRVLNDPARVKNRYALLRALRRAGLNDFTVCLAEDFPADLRYPVFIRKRQGHRGLCSGLLESAAGVESRLNELAGEGVPLENLMITEYAGEPVRPGLFRKQSVFRMGDRMVPYLCVHDSQWHAKQGAKGIAGDELYEDEFRLLHENPHGEEIRRRFEIAEIDYGRADFGFYRGRLQTFEINTNPLVPRPQFHPVAQRRQSIALAWQKFLAGVRGLDSEPGPAVRLSDDPLLRHHRKWTRLFSRTRLVE